MLKVVSTIGFTGGTTGALVYQGTWNANTNTPDLNGLSPEKGYYYVVSVAGTTSLDGIDFWGVGDWAVYNGSVWERVEGGTETDTDKIVFNTQANLTPSNGEMAWADDDRLKTVAVGINGDNFYLFEDQIFRVRASSNITKGQVIMFSGTLGASGGLEGAPATGLTPEQANYILGVSKDTFTSGNWGNVQYFGEVKGINTTGGAENWQQGDVLYYNPSVTGGLTKIKPIAPAAIAVVAAVVYVSANNGILFVRPTYGSVLGGTDGNVNFTSLANNDVIVYNTTSNVWTNQTPANVVAGTGLTGGGQLLANSNVTVSLANTTVSANTYGGNTISAVVTIDAQGRVTSASNVAIDFSGGLPDPLIVNNFEAANVTVTANLFANLATSNTAAMPDPSLPLNPEGYVEIVVNGSTKKVPYYGV
jgi:hypothetical protein